MLWRSGHPDHLDDAGWAEFEAIGVHTVIDLRNPDERTRARRSPGGMRVMNLPLERVDDPEYITTWRNDWATPEFYAWGRARWPELWTAVLTAIADSPGGVLVHCAGGRDRTGVVAAVLLDAAGVEREALLDDYVRGIRESPRRDIDSFVPEYRAALGRLLDTWPSEPALLRAASRLVR